MHLGHAKWTPCPSNLQPLHHWDVQHWSSYASRSNITTMHHYYLAERLDKASTADDKQHQWHQHRDQSEWTEAWDSHKLQIPGFSYNWWRFQAWVTLQDSTSNISIDKAETNLDWQEHFSQLQDTTDALPCHSHLPVCLLIMDPHSRAPKKNTSHGNDVLPQDTTHLIQRP